MPESTPAPTAVLPYTALAAGYDIVMEHVDYADWAEYVHELLQSVHPSARMVLELGCGTGTFAFTLSQIGNYKYIGTDGSIPMVRVARAKAEMYNIPIQFEVADFTNYGVSNPVDAVLLLYDGLNYLLNVNDVAALLRCTYKALKPGGVFFFDQSTPANSINNADFFEDEGEVDDFTYVRRSSYDQDKRIHTTTFDITVEGTTYHEKHQQRAYTYDELAACIERTPFVIEAAYDGFSDESATANSERIHWLLRKPEA